jgi:hypothetical protein
MAQSLPEKLAEWVAERATQPPRPRSQNKHRVAFLALKGEVEAALAAGYSRKTIWEYLRKNEQLECRYETFTQYIKRYLGKDKLKGDAKEKAKEMPTKALPSKSVAEPTKKSSELDRFKFDATPQPPEELF